VNAAPAELAQHTPRVALPALLARFPGPRPAPEAALVRTPSFVGNGHRRVAVGLTGPR
jgi:hypothetical protein